MNVMVAVSLNISEPLTYKWNSKIEPLPGMRVVVPLGRRVVTGWIVEAGSEYKGRLRSVIGYVDDSWRPDDTYMGFIKEVAGVYFMSRGTLLDYALSPGRKALSSLRFEVDGKKKKLSDYKATDFTKLAGKEGIRFFYNRAEEYESNRDESGSESFEHNTYLGFDQLEECRRVLLNDRENGKNTLIVVPDSYTGSYIKNILGGDLYVSSLKVKERGDIWKRYAEGETGLLIGGLSALMLPVVNRGSVIFFRSGSYHYSGNSFTDYNLYDLAYKRAESDDTLFYEVGSVNDIVSTASEKRVLKDTRPADSKLINVHMIKPGATEMPPVIKEMLRDSFLNGKRVAVIMNKKQSSGYLYCKKCKTSKRCRSCDNAVIINSKPYGLSVVCGSCGVSEDKVSTCNCGSEYIHVEKPGINSALEMVKREITDKEVEVFTAEEQKKGGWSRESKIFIGTPAMVTPDFNNFFDSVIVLRPENYVDLDAYNGAERLRNFVCEMRELLRPEGSVEVFSVFHFHYSLQTVNSDKDFNEREMGYREMFKLPPFCNVYELEIKSTSLRKLGAEMRDIIKRSADLGVSRAGLKSRKAVRGAWKGVIELHARPEAIEESGILKRRDVFVKLLFS